MLAWWWQRSAYLSNALHGHRLASARVVCHCHDDAGKWLLLCKQPMLQHETVS